MGECLKNLLGLHGRHADARILHHKLHPRRPILGTGSYAQGDSASGRELVGIVEQVVQNLAHFIGVAHHVALAKG